MLMQGIRYEHCLQLDTTIRRLGITMVVAIVLSYLLIIVAPDYLLVLYFVILWPSLFFGWPYLSRRVSLPSRPKSSAPPKPNAPVAARLFLTAVLASALAVVLARLIDRDVVGIAFVPFWLALFYGWPFLSRRPAFLNSSKAQVNPPAPKRPLWLRLMRGTLAWVGGILLTLLLLAMTAIVPITLCHRRAQRVHDSIHIGMSVAEELHAARDCDVFQASSEFPHDDDADGDDIPAINLRWGTDGLYRTYDLASHQDIQLSEAEAIERLHSKLRDGFPWHFRYTYINMTPQHVSFSVVFGPDGHVREVAPVYGWD